MNWFTHFAVFTLAVPDKIIIGLMVFNVVCLMLAIAFGVILARD